MLRRRAKELQADYNEQYVGCLLRAADEIEARRLASTDEEQAIVDAIADNRRLRQCLQGMFGRIHSAPIPKGIRKDWCNVIAVALKVTKELGIGRRILAIQVGDDATRDDLVAAATAQIDLHLATQLPAAPLVETALPAQAPFESVPVDEVNPAATAAFRAHLDVCGQCFNNPMELCPLGAVLLAKAADYENNQAPHGVDGDSRPLDQPVDGGRVGQPLPNFRSS